MNADELRTASEQLRETVALKSGKWDDSMLADVLRECAPLCEEEFYRALQRPTQLDHKTNRQLLSMIPSHLVK